MRHFYNLLGIGAIAVLLYAMFNNLYAMVLHLIYTGLNNFLLIGANCIVIALAIGWFLKNLDFNKEKSEK